MQRVFEDEEEMSKVVGADYAYIELSKGFRTVVDLDSFEKFGSLKWYAKPARKDGHVYAVRSVVINGKIKRYSLHREILEAKKGEVVDHINMDSLDNRRSNLRTAFHFQNHQNKNKTKGTRKYSSVYKGVMKRGNRWAAVITYRKNIIFLGMFSTDLEAARVYDVASQFLFGSFGVLNFRRNKKLDICIGMVIDACVKKS